MRSTATGHASSHEAVAERAYLFYLQQGRPEGRAIEHWLTAELSVDAERRGERMAIGVAPDAVRVELLDEHILELREGLEPRIGRALLNLVEALPAPRLVVDLGRVRHLCSAMIGGLVAAARRAREKGGGLHLTRLTPDVREELALCRVDRLIEIEPAPTPALA